MHRLHTQWLWIVVCVCLQPAYADNNTQSNTVRIGIHRPTDGDVREISGSSWFSIGYEHRLRDAGDRSTFVSADYSSGSGTINDVILGAPATFRTKSTVIYLMYGQRVKREGQRSFYEYAGGLVHAKSDITGTAGGVTVTDGESKSDLALSIGGGVELSDRVVLQLRYLWGNRPINEGISLSVGASF